MSLQINIFFKERKRKYKTTCFLKLVRFSIIEINDIYNNLIKRFKITLIDAVIENKNF